MAYMFHGRSILVTGAGRGIGFGIAKSLANMGASVIALSKTKTNLDLLVKEAPDIQIIHQNLNNWKETRDVVSNIEYLDGLVNCAAIVSPPKPTLAVTAENLDLHFNVNLKAAINTMQVAGKKMIETGKGGSIVNISSVIGEAAVKGALSYSVSKAGLNMATKVFALELGPHKIRVNAVSPTWVRTEALDQFSVEFLEQYVSKIPAGRMCEIQDVVDKVLFLLSEQSKMISGTVTNLDGAHSICLSG